MITVVDSVQDSCGIGVRHAPSRLKTPVLNSTKNKAPLDSARIISLFSGAGGFDCGMIEAGHRIIWANDNDKDSCETYRRNIGNHVVCSDISLIPSNAIPSGDVVIGGFPCQGFSQANRLRSVNDERNTLYLEFLRVVRDKQPAYFLAENVRGIITLERGAVIRQIVSDFASAGYRVSFKLFNAADFGVPQQRKRVIIWGTRNDLPKYADFLPPAETHGISPESSNLKPWVSIGETLKDIPEPGDYEYLPNHINSKYKVTNRNFTGHRRTDPCKPSPTILARGNGKGGVCAIQHPQNHRRMTIRESAIVQTFPLNFEFFGKMNSCYRQVGNAVAVRFAYALGLALKSTMQKLHSHQ